MTATLAAPARPIVGLPDQRFGLNLCYWVAMLGFTQGGHPFSADGIHLETMRRDVHTHKWEKTTDPREPYRCLNCGVGGTT